MEERRLGPVVGLGTWNTFDTDRDLARLVVGAALDAGCHLFDSSPMYGGAEVSLGFALGERRAEAIVATKIWAGSVEEGSAQFQNQLSWFGRVEIEQVHNLVAWEDHLPWLEAERDAGRIDRLGVTHWQASAFAELARALKTRRFSVLQVPYSPLEQECEDELLPLAAELGVAVIAMRPLGDKSRLRNPLPAGALAPLKEFGISTWPQALLKWALSEQRIDAVIPATRNPGHLRENAAVGEPPWLGPEERRLVERLAQT
ncbi:MAG: aldo/keto reductase [Actinomycetota bacterium]|nr:aldo/keto reductase [Actinomycetota bacterium]